MGILFSYSLYSSILLSLLYLSYKWVLAGENQHAYNRTALWLICLVALLGLPLLRLAASIGADAPAAVMSEIEMGQIQIGLAADESVGSQPLWLTAVLWIYLSGVVLTAVQTLLIVLRLWRIISAGETVSEGPYRIILTDDRGIAPFSWWRYVVMSRSDWNESGRMILTHELKHLSLRHWIDLAVAQIISIFQWYNPSAWLMREQGNCGDCVAFKAYIDGSETGQGTQLENVTRVDLPRGRENVIGIYEISKMSLTFKSLEDARITLEKQGELRRIEIREAIQYMDCVQRRIGLHAVKHVIMGRFLDFLQNPITYGGNRETTVRFVVSSYSVYGDGDEILWMEAEP